MSLVVVVDPAWLRDAGGGGRGAQHHYALSSVDAIALSYRRHPLWSDVGPALVWMWATTSAVCAGDAHVLARALGMRICASWVWAKCDVDEDGKPVVPPAAPGIGQWQRTEHEYLFLCRRGDVQVPAPADRMRSVIYAPRGAHSEKPPEAWEIIERTSARAFRGDDAPVRVEFNARVARPGWWAVGRLDGEEQDIVTRQG